MHPIGIANAPCSWGTLEFKGVGGERIEYGRMLDELRDTGYTGTELGDWGYMPTDPAALRAELDSRTLAMLGAFVPVALRDPRAHAPGAAEAVKVARLLASVADIKRGGQLPFIVLADDNGKDPTRTKHAGRVTPEMGLSADEWNTVAQGAESIARAVLDVTGLPLVFHHHCAGFVETPEEIDRFLEGTNPDLVNMVFDTGHFLYGTGRDEPEGVLEGLRRFGPRVTHVHFKDLAPAVAAQARAGGWDYFEAIGHGLFCELGKGVVPFEQVAAWLRAQEYSGWIVVEQDVLPGMGTPKASAGRSREYLRSIGL